VTTDSSPAQHLVGAVLNQRWRLIRLLGEGGMGAVYEADGVRGEGKRAIKLLHQEFVKEDLILQRFFAEATASRSLQHPNVAQVFDTATAENGTPYLVMELLQGTPLATYVDQGQAFPPQQAGQIVVGVLQALGAAHARSIVHRDVKPDNLFLVTDASGAFTVKVLDFGIAKVMDVAGGMGQKTRTGVLLGTPGYMSPEQIKNSKGVDARTDLWSVGIIFYELLSGKQPFPADNEFARLTSVLSEEVKPIEQVAPHLAAWSPFFMRALAKDPARRFQTADEMAQAVVSHLRQPSLRPQQHPSTQQGAGPPPEWSRPSVPYAAMLAQQAAPQREASGVMQSPMATVAMPQLPDLPHQQSGLMHSPMATAPMSAGAMQQYLMAQPMSAAAMQQQSGLIPAPMSMAQPMPPAGWMPATNSQPPPPSYPMGAPLAASPTAVSAQRPPGTPSIQGHTPSIDVIEAPHPRSQGVPYWAVGVVAFVAFGLGLALGLILG
jgi:serine/threonine-protein kinase